MTRAALRRRRRRLHQNIGATLSTREASIHLAVDDVVRFVLYGVSVLLNVDLRAAQIELLIAQSARRQQSAHVTTSLCCRRPACSESADST